jgi:glycosyl transferase family 25
MAELPLILVINLARDTLRWQQVAKALAQLALPYQRVAAIDARRHGHLVEARLLPRPISPILGRALSLAERCCALSHIAALKRVVRSRRPVAMILEDDARFDDRFKGFLTDALPTFLHHCDIVKCEGLAYPYTSETGPRLAHSAACDLIVPLHPTLGAAAYAVTQHGARRLLARYAGLAEPLDHMLAYYERHGIAYGETRPLLVWQADYPSQVTATIAEVPQAPVRHASVGARLGHSRLVRGLTRLALAVWWVGRAWVR